jgi:hypothetical protein
MPLLAIETTCDETAAAVITRSRDVLSSVVASQDALHARWRGVVPEVASRAHVERIIPVIDLRQRFGLPSTEATKETCIIVLEASEQDGTQTVMGAIVDSVREVQDIPKTAIEGAPEFGCEIPLRYILGMGKVKDKVIVLLEIGEVIGLRERAQIAGAIKDTASAVGADRRAA